MLRCDAAKELKIIEDNNGFLRLSGVIATAGEKLRYVSDGVITEETVTDEALFSNMDELEGSPFTNEHPLKLVTINDASRLTKGAVITPRRDGNELWVDIKATDAKTIQDIKNGKRGLSAGYTCSVDELGNQVSRNYNHVALCNIGRSPSSGIRADERRDSFDITTTTEGQHMKALKFPNGKTVNLDCSDAELELAQGHIDTLTARADKADESLAKVSTFLSENFDMKEGEDMPKKLDMMKKEIADMKKKGESTEKLQATYDALFEKMEKSKGKMDGDDLAIIFDTHEKAQKLDGKITIRKDTGEIKTARELAEEALPNVKLDGKSDDYAFARLDSTIEFSSSDNVKKQRGDGKEAETKSTLTVQQRADAKFYDEKGGK